MRWLVAYDISDDTARADVAAILGAEGVRLQRSVFEVETQQPQQLMQRLEQLINPERDVIHAFPLCTACRSTALHVGQTGTSMAEHWWII